MIQEPEFIEQLETGLLAFRGWTLLNPIAVNRLMRFFGLLPPESGIPNANLSREAQERTYAYIFKDNFGNTAYKELFYLKKVSLVLITTTLVAKLNNFRPHNIHNSTLIKLNLEIRHLLLFHLPMSNQVD